MSVLRPIAVLAALNLAFDIPDRDTPPAVTAPVAKPAATPVSAAVGDDSALQLDSLLARLDSALGDDGRLI